MIKEVVLKMKAIVLLADGFEECEGLIVVDILRRAGVSTVTASIMGRLTVYSSRQILVVADVLAESIDFNDADMLVLPGGKLGTENLAKSELVREQCLSFARDRKIAAICAAPSLLAELGILNGKKATCHPDFEAKMCGAELTRASVTVDDNVITGQGLGAAFKFSFKLAEILTDRETVESIKRGICY